MTPLDRARLSLEGLSVGDAFGERLFGDLRVVLPRILDRQLPAGPWRWTDDTVMSVAVVETLSAHGGIDADALAWAFARRYREDPARGYGRGAHSILGEILAGTPWRAAAAAVFGGGGSMGNGAAMRSAPIGAYFLDDLSAVVRHASESAAPTHAHPEGKAGAVAVAVAAALAHRERAGGPLRGDELLAEVIAHTPPGATRDGLCAARALGPNARGAEAAEALGSGQDVLSSDTVPFSVYCAARHVGAFEEGLWQTVAGLGDRDTTCAMVGGILAGSVGSEGIPREWRARREALPTR